MQILPRSGSLALARELSVHLSRGLEERLSLAAERARAERVRYLADGASTDAMPRPEFLPSGEARDAARSSSGALRVDAIAISAAGRALLGA